MANCARTASFLYNGRRYTIRCTQNILTNVCRRSCVTRLPLQNMARYAVYNQQQHKQMISLMQRSDQIALMLYSQKQDFTFDMTYACHEATELYREFSKRRMPYDRIMKRMDAEIVRYQYLMETLSNIPPSLKMQQDIKNGKAKAPKFVLDKDGKLPKIEGALLADSIATTGGALLGTSTVTTFVESSAGVAVGGRTGLTAVTAAILFFLSLFFAPIFLAIPSFATAPALIVVGFYMLTNVTHIDFDDFSEALPCYICILAMPFFYSISEGISMGVISYVILNLMTGKAKEKKISALMYVLTVLFILKYVFL